MYASVTVAALDRDRMTPTLLVIDGVGVEERVIVRATALSKVLVVVDEIDRIFPALETNDGVTVEEAVIFWVY